MPVRIYKPAKTAMQSGTARASEWVLEHEPETARPIDPLMGWTGSSDMKSQVKLSFATKEQAVAYATRNGLVYRIEEPKPHRVAKKSYSDNFKWGRKDAWTH